MCEIVMVSSRYLTAFSNSTEISFNPAIFDSFLLRTDSMDVDYYEIQPSGLLKQWQYSSNMSNRLQKRQEMLKKREVDEVVCLLVFKLS